MFFCNKQAKVCENCDFLLTFAHLRDFCFAKSLIFIKDLRNLREVELGVADVDVGLREGYLDAALVEGVVDVLLDARQVGQTCLDRDPQHHLEVDTALAEVIEQHLDAFLLVVSVECVQAVDSGPGDGIQNKHRDADHHHAPQSRQNSVVHPISKLHKFFVTCKNKIG